MPRAIQQSIVLKASPKALFDAFLDSRQHSAITGAKATTGRRPGMRFSAFDGALSGRNLMIVRDRLIVQSWRVSNWKKTDADSVLILRFSPARGGTRVDLTHVGVPAHDHKGVTKGWRSFYWLPWRTALAQASGKRAKPPARKRPAVKRQVRKRSA